MAIPGDRILFDPRMAFPHQADFPSPGSFPIAEYHSSPFTEASGFNKLSTGGVQSSPLTVNSAGFSSRKTSYQTDIPQPLSQSLINFRSGIGSLMHTSESLLSFEQSEGVEQNNNDEIMQKEDYSDLLRSSLDQGHYQWNHMATRCLDDFNCFQTASGHSYMTSPTKENHLGGEGFSSTFCWPYSDATLVSDSIQEPATTYSRSVHKRLHMGESMETLQNASPTKKQKPKSSPVKDPQSVAAKNRRERISERLKTLQELVPNGSKVDLVTMLEKAISYVKFLQLQVKVLATDEFWPAQGGKAPGISQVKEAIDAVLSSQRERSSGSNCGR